MALSNGDFQDMQGLLRFGYARLTEACFLLLQIEDSHAAGLWLETAPVSTAEVQDPPPSRALQLAFTFQGLHKLGLEDTLLNGFSAEFIAGMTADENRSRRLGDTGQSAPQYWEWGRPDDLPDLVAMIYAKPDEFEAWKSTLESGLTQAGFKLLRCLPTTDMHGVEPFGFVDGVSQPQPDWEGQRSVTDDKVAYENVAMLGEFVLGYPNEYGKYTDRPTLAEQADADLPNAEDQPGRKDIGRNGTYLVLRQLEQDVHSLWRSADQYANGDAAQRQDLLEKMVGRHMSGDPLLPLDSQHIVGVGSNAENIQQNQFTFVSDPDGTRCPLGAHIRRANPRNADFPADTKGLLARFLRILGFGQKSMRDDMLASTRFHRLIRRGREYGLKLEPEQRLQPPQSNEPASGLQFVCLNANIGRQFEFVQSAWLMSNKFDGLSDEDDPILGSRESVSGCPIHKFSLPIPDHARQQISNLPRFVTVRGGAYFFLPGVRALRYFARTARF
jgi:deferrochelatase/peroxidase EfeB